MRFLSKLLILLLIVTGTSFAGYRGKVIWHRSYFISLGVDALFSLGGDLNGDGAIEANGDDTDDVVYLPHIGSFPLPNIEAGVNFNQHTISVNFGIWQPDVRYGEDTDYFTEDDANYWRLGVEYRYYFFWPEDFMIGPGLGYAFARYSVHGAAIGFDKYDGEYREAAVFATNSFAVSANMRYKIRPFGMDVALRYRPTFIRSLSTETAGYCSLSETLWHHMIEVSARVFLEF